MDSKQCGKIPLVCRFCMKMQLELSVHLRRVCRKDADPTEIKKLVQEARIRMLTLVKNQSVVDMEEVEAFARGFSDPSMAIASFLETHGALIRQKHTESSSQQGVSSAQSIETDEEGVVLALGNKAIRKKMADAGLYKKHSTDCLLLANFQIYLQQTACLQNIKQEVINLSRFLYYINPEEASVKFVENFEKTIEFFDILKDLAVPRKIQLNYLKSLNLFLQWQLSVTNKSGTFYNDCENYLKALEDVQKKIKKVEKRQGLPLPRTTSIEDCRRVLLVAKAKLLDVITKASEGLPDKDKLMVLYYLEALIILGHLQKPAVITNMTVRNWLERQQYIYKAEGEEMKFAFIKIKIPSTNSEYPEQSANICLSHSEELWFDIYFKSIRPTMLSPTVETEVFFITTAGVKKKNLSVDMNRFFQKFSVPAVSSQKVRHAAEEWAKSNLSEAEKRLFDSYLAYSNMPEEGGDEQQTIEDQIRAAILVANIGKRSEDAYVEEEGHLLASQRDEDFQNLLKRYPVSINKESPTVKECRSISPLNGQYCYNRWRTEQYKMRLDDVISHFGTSQPNKRQIKLFIERQCWGKNIPRESDICEQWKPRAARGESCKDHNIHNNINEQSWKGLVIVTDSAKGEKVVTTRPFEKGEIVCDYHGDLLTVEEGLKLMGTIQSATMGYTFFFKDRSGKRWCIDAQNVPCQCHPELNTTFGRKINHSRKMFNLKPQLHYFADKPVILLVAIDNIPVGTELLYNYGVTRHSFGGEGEDLTWLDQ